MIEKARNIWLLSEKSTINSVIDYIEQNNKMRDAQIDAIKTYLYLKIGCGNKPLAQLFSKGTFNTINLEEIELSASSRNYLQNHPSSTALLEYSMQKDDDGNQVSPKLEKAIKHNPESIDSETFFTNVFYDVSYTDYLFSLPMGAGKTWLMAAFIYLDLYYALQEPDNPIFAHNFIVFAPSGLKSSVVPSLRTIQDFDPTWIIPDPAASNIKRRISFEVLDQEKTAKKSNKTRNPNVQKIANHQPFDSLLGLVLVTNAEKVILDRIPDGKYFIQFPDQDISDEKDKQANELRNLIGKLPSLSIFIDEVHHAVTDEIKLRSVVSHWAEQKSINSVIGFSGTPYLEKFEEVTISDKLSLSSSEISNIVYYYPLINGIGNFLKKPIVKIANFSESPQIINAGVRDFLDTYKDKKYEGKLTAKLGIYCGTIEKLEETVYPLVCKILLDYGLDSSAILKFHRGNKKYPQPADSQMEYDNLDKSFSKIRIILLVQIGKEGWNCRSLTGIILSQAGDCPPNMVLQTSCRCLRQISRNEFETALIFLNSDNASVMNNQLQQQHHISLKEFSEADNESTTIKRYDRREHLKLPHLDFYQLKISYETLVVDENIDTSSGITFAANNCKRENTIITTDFQMNVLNTKKIAQIKKEQIPITFTEWIYLIAKESFGFITIHQLEQYESVLNTLFENITIFENNSYFFNYAYDQKQIRSNIRKAFYEKRSFTIKEEIVPYDASFLDIKNFTPTVSTFLPNEYFPNQQIVENIIKADSDNYSISDNIAKIIDLAKASGETQLAASLEEKYKPYPKKERTFHYIPYKTDSTFEIEFLKSILELDVIKKYNLEVYYNGDRFLTDFKIQCFRGGDGHWQNIGVYTPDFLIIQRQNNGIYKVIIVETKGTIFAKDNAFLEKRTFMETKFTKMNNDKYGYKRFDFLYLEDSTPNVQRMLKVQDAITAFFGEN